MDHSKLDNRIIGYEEVDPQTLLANPQNFRIRTEL
jgi:hypothetical protein